ncbi:O-antigen ligase family protein [Kineococcus rhizosphaerae]|uniref:O-antigen ligase n=1 Tax=Kineococcus rhizosphaerae TaxID=559628 RepID=A0A2T0QYI8_9ACTN|nr:O-antigen ligase family protein [Kineococcus rhizosphaerae]PRY11416.1 O-antigen ligase [Kineococcus rhizosphaerae]
MILTLVLALAAAFTGLLFCVTAGDRTRLLVAAFLAVPQLYVGPLATLNLPLSQCWVILIAVCRLLERKQLPVRDPVLGAVLLLALVQGLAISWSPVPVAGILEVARLLSFAFLTLYATDVERRRAGALTGPFTVVLGWAVLDAVLVWAFRLSPALESTFLSSPLATLIVGPDAMTAFFAGGANNVTDPAKAGGFFINANVSSMFLGVATFGFLALGVGLRGRRRRAYGLGALVCWSATFATGSKTAAALALVLPLAVRGVQVLGRPRAKWFLPQAAAAIGLGVWQAPRLLEKVVPGYADASSASLESRQPMWDFALTMFREHAVLGLGFGGWARTIEQFASLGITALPPHNLFIAAWANSGLPGVAALLTLAVTILVVLTRAVVRHAGTPAGRTTAFALGAWWWVLIHGMGDNTAVYGEAKSMILLAMLLGLVTSRLAALRSREEAVPCPA